MGQARSVKCKRIVPAELRSEIDPTLQGVADACNQILKVAHQQKCDNTTKLHHLTDYPVKAATGLTANHVCQAIRRALGAWEATKQVKQFRPTSLSLDTRTFAYNPHEPVVGSTLMRGRKTFKRSIGGYPVAWLSGQKLTSATLNKTRQGEYCVNFAIELDTPPTGQRAKGIGVDGGQKEIAHTSTGPSWSGGQLQRTREKQVKMRASIQSKGLKGAKRLLKRLSGTDKKFQTWVNPNISKQLVEEAQQLNAGLAFEDLTGIQLKHFTTYKAAMAGVPVLSVPAPYTSQTHYRCLRIGQRKGKDFWCECLHEDAELSCSLMDLSAG